MKANTIREFEGNYRDSFSRCALAMQPEEVNWIHEISILLDSAVIISEFFFCKTRVITGFY